MAEIAFMSVDPDHEISGHEDTENCEELDEQDIHVPKMKEVINFLLIYVLRLKTISMALKKK